MQKGGTPPNRFIAGILWRANNYHIYQHVEIYCDQGLKKPYIALICCEVTTVKVVVAK